MMTVTRTVRDYMAKELVTFGRDMDLHRAIKLLLSKGISGAPVVDDEGNLVGVLSKKDCLKVAFGASYHKELAGPVADYMSTKVKTVPSRMNIFFVAGMFLNDHIRRFPVVDDGKLVGAITRFDILRAIHKAHEEGVV